MLSYKLIYCILSFGLIILVIYAGQYIIKYSAYSETKMIIKWFVLLIIINIIITTFIFISYSSIKFNRGPPGPQGKRGVDGSQGNNGSCIMCSPAMAGLKPIREPRVDRIDPMLPHSSEKKLLFNVNIKQET